MSAKMWGEGIIGDLFYTKGEQYQTIPGPNAKEKVKSVEVSSLGGIRVNRSLFRNKYSLKQHVKSYSTLFVCGLLHISWSIIYSVVVFSCVEPLMQSLSQCLRSKACLLKAFVLKSLFVLIDQLDVGFYKSISKLHCGSINILGLINLNFV